MSNLPTPLKWNKLRPFAIQRKRKFVNFPRKSVTLCYTKYVQRTCSEARDAEHSPPYFTALKPHLTAVAQRLRCWATNRKVAGSIPAGFSGFFIDIKSFRSHYGPGVDSASNRNEYQEYLLEAKLAGALCWQPTTILCRCHEIWET